MEYNSLACYENNGAEPKIKDFDDSANAVYTALQTGMSYPQVTSWQDCWRVRSWYAAAPCRTSFETVRMKVSLEGLVEIVRIRVWVIPHIQMLCLYLIG